jgi:hypothetical protein
MKKSIEYLIIIIFILLSISLNLYFRNSIENNETIESYHTKRQVESILNTGLPLYNDELSYSGRKTVFSPGYYYLLASSLIILPEKIVYNIIPSILSSLVILIIYFITKKLTNNGSAAFFSAFLSLFIPIYNLKTINSISANIIVIPLMLSCLHLFSITDENNKKIINWFILLLCFLSIISPNVFILIISLLIYVILLKIENISLNKIKKELIIFSIFFVLWIQFIIYKKALLMHGPYIIWQNIPIQLIINYFSEINILNIIYYVGIVPFFCGLYVIYKYSFKTKNEHLYLYIAMASVSTLLLLFRLIELKLGLIYLGFCFVIFFSVFYKNLIIYINKTKFNKYKTHITILIVIIFFFTSIIPSIALLEKNQLETAIPLETIEALKWLKNNTPTDSVILGTINEGILINAISYRKNIIDNNFLMVHDINYRVNDIRIIYTSSSLIRAIELLNYYNVNYIFLDSAKKEYKIEDLRYSNSECVELVYDENIKIYKVICMVESYD